MKNETTFLSTEQKKSPTSKKLKVNQTKDALCWGAGIHVHSTKKCL